MFTRKEENKPHVPARVWAYGRARIEIAQRAQTREDWDDLWKPPIQPFAFQWGQHWKHCIEYKVADFTAEVGFFIDLLGLPVNAFNQDYAMFTSPDHEFYFAVIPAGKANPTPSDALRLQFMVADIFSSFEELKRRGIQFVQEPQPVSQGSNQWVAAFQTPNGICMELWGLVIQNEISHQDDYTQEQGDELKQPVIQEPNIPKSPSPSYTQNPKFPVAVDADEDQDEDEDDFTWTELDDSAETTADADIAGDSSHKDFELDPDETNLEPQPFTYTARPKQPQVKVAQPVKTYQTAQEMLNHLKQKQPLSEPIAKPMPLRQPAESNPRPGFSPAPKKTTDMKPKSVWDTVSMEEEYIDVDEKAPEEYHYKPIPLNRDE